MSKKQQPKNYNVATMQPDELNALKALVKEFVDRMQNVDNEINLLKADRKELILEFREKLDVKTLNAALRVVKIKQNVEHHDTFDMFMSALVDSE